MRVLRMTTRRWIVTVVISAGLMGIGVEVKRELRCAHDYRRIAEVYGIAETLNHGQSVTFPNGTTMQGRGSAELATYYMELRRKYERAASRPWLYVEPDPPEPWP
jgi:hypothetical protein